MRNSDVGKAKFDVETERNGLTPQDKELVANQSSV